MDPRFRILSVKSPLGYVLSIIEAVWEDETLQVPIEVD